MKKHLPAFFLLLLAATATLAFALPTTWKLNDKYQIKFKSDNPSGSFKTMSGDIAFDPTDLTHSKFNMVVDVSSISTGNGMKNRHAKGEDWFDSKKYPNITFVSSSITKTSSGFETKGQLTMHGTTKEITIPFTFSSNTFSGTFKVNRLDYGIGDMEGMHKKASQDIDVELQVPVSK